MAGAHDYLVVVGGPHRGHQVQLGKGPCLIARGAKGAGDLDLAGDELVARAGVAPGTGPGQALVKPVDGGRTLVDLASTNTT